MNRCIPVFALVFLASSALTAQAEEASDAKKEPPASGRDTCVFSRTINDWHVIDNRTLAVWAPSRKTPYIVTLTRPAIGLKFEQSLGFEDHNNDGQFCEYGGDSIVIGGTVPDRVTIASIRRVEADEVKRLIAEADKPKEKPKAAMPEQSDMKSEKPEEKKE